MAKPTERQVAFLERFSLWIPKNKLLASRMISFVKNGNGADYQADDDFARAELLRETQELYSGKLVVSEQYGEGQVLYVVPRTAEEVAELKASNSEYHGHNIASPFNVTVKWQDASKCVALSLVEIKN